MRSQDGLWARALNLLLGGWLVISAFVWAHSPAERVNTALVGYLCFLIALFATRIPKARHLNSALAVWLFISAWTLPHAHAGTQWNNALVAISMFVLSLIPGWRQPLGALGPFVRGERLQPRSTDRPV